MPLPVAVTLFAYSFPASFWIVKTLPLITSTVFRAAPSAPKLPFAVWLSLKVILPSLFAAVSKSVVELAATVNLIAELAPFKVVFVAFKTAVVERSTRPLPIVTDWRAAPLPIFVTFAVEAPSNFSSPWPATAPLISVDSKFTPSLMFNEEPFAIVTVTILLLPALANVAAFPSFMSNNFTEPVLPT